ncbi:MAG: hypothetical protein K2Y40_12670 [Reyranella sp.]|nr:hypothetical protein [Reyranella sp.]
MSDFLLPPGSLVLASLYRPALNTPGIGLANFLTATPTRDVVVAAALIREGDQLTAGLPELLLPGVPVCLLLHLLLPDGQTFASSSVAEVARATRREAAAASLFRALPALLDGAFETMRGKLGAQAAAAAPTAPTTTTVQ